MRSKLKLFLLLIIVAWATIPLGVRVVRAQLVCQGGCMCNQGSGSQCDCTGFTNGPLCMLQKYSDPGRTCNLPPGCPLPPNNCCGPAGPPEIAVNCATLCNQLEDVLFDQCGDSIGKECHTFSACVDAHCAQFSLCCDQPNSVITSCSEGGVGGTQYCVLDTPSNPTGPFCNNLFSCDCGGVQIGCGPASEPEPTPTPTATATATPTNTPIPPGPRPPIPTPTPTPVLESIKTNRLVQ
jgi:hypothetical protein